VFDILPIFLHTWQYCEHYPVDGMTEVRMNASSVYTNGQCTEMVRRVTPRYVPN